jgi:hypothetical protein
MSDVLWINCATKDVLQIEYHFRYCALISSNTRCSTRFPPFSERNIRCLNTLAYSGKYSLTRLQVYYKLPKCAPPMQVGLSLTRKPLAPKEILTSLKMIQLTLAVRALVSFNLSKTVALLFVLTQSAPISYNLTEKLNFPCPNTSAYYTKNNITVNALVLFDISKTIIFQSWFYRLRRTHK